MSSQDQPGHVPVPPDAARELLGDQLPLMQQYVDRLADTGVSHGLVGPREVPRLWTRHILNCAVVAELMTTGSDVIDIGTGAGLPGIVLAIARPDLRMTLVEPLLRRVTWLESVISELELPNAVVVRSRAEDQWGKISAGTVTSRAVAPLDKLARWSLPLVRPGGQMVALKGSSAQQELAEVADDLASWGVIHGEVLECGGGVVEPATIVTRLSLSSHPQPGSLARPRVPQTGASSARRGGRHTDRNSIGKKKRR